MLTYYTDQNLDFFEIKKCRSVSQSEKAHFHNEISIILIEDSITYVTSDKQIEYKFEKDSFVIIPSFKTHNCVPVNKDEFKFTIMYLSSEWFEKTFHFNLDNKEIQFYKLNSDEVKEVINLFEIFQSDISPITKEFNLIKFLEKYLIEKTDFSNESQINSVKQSKLELVRKYLSQNYNEKVSLEKLSEISGLSKYHLTRSFKSKYDLSPLNYQKNIKFNHAKKFLRRNNNISDLALDLGYYDQSHFTNEFKKFSGISPKKYRKSTKH